MKIEKLIPACKDYLWGGDRLKTGYGKITDLCPLAETWELSLHKDGMAHTQNGTPLSEVMTKEVMGKRAAAFPYFPVLTKFIDAASDLSVQVHPSDEYARKNEDSYGKTEMWYVVDADEDAGIYLGFKENVSREEFEAAIAEKRLTELLNFIRVKSGDCYFIQAGTIHAIGKGCLIYEIQQNSNLTYRVYDYGRRGKDGKERELHIEKAKAVSRLERFVPETFDGDVLGTCEYFTAKKHEIRDTVRLFTDENSFNAVTCVGGEGEIAGESIRRGDTFLVPAGYGEYNLSGNLEIIVTSV